MEQKTSEKLQVLVVDDEVIIADTICTYLNQLGYDALEPAINYTEALRCLEEKTPDIAILDIHLSGKKTGVDLAKHIQKYYDFPFIYLTSHTDEKTISDAKETHPHAYIVKPFSKEELYSAIEIAVYNYAVKKGKVEKKETKDFLITNAFFVRDKNALNKINFDEVLYIRSAHVYAEIVLKDDKMVVVRGSLNNLLDSLNDKFIRIHRGYIINSKHITKIDGSSIFIGKTELPIGKKFRDELLKSISII